MPGVYISYPFCNQKCSFCNFSSGVSPFETRARYHRALLNEIRAWEWNWAPETVYFGGGTPSLMPEELLSELMKLIPGERLTEVTLECAPGTITEQKIGTWRECGVNRVSLGVQSFIAAELGITGRRHDASTVSSGIGMLREGGIENINIDLIAGLPKQNVESWEDSLRWIERVDPPHVSVYIFEIDEDSRLGKEIMLGGSRYGAKDIPNEDLTAELYELAVERLERLGLERYEISNFARPGWESRHNLKYWRLEPYVGFGLDAHSYDGRNRWNNPDAIGEYLAQGNSGGSTVRNRIEIDPHEEHFFVGLRLMSGIEPTPEEWSRFAEPIEKYLRDGMLERAGDRLRLSPRAVLVSNEIFEDFVHG